VTRVTFLFDCGLSQFTERKVIRLSLTESVGEAYMAVELDAHQSMLKEEILKIISHKPTMGLGIFKRRGEHVVLISIGRLFKPACADLGKRVLLADTVIGEDESDSFYTLECLKEVSRAACSEAGVLFSGVGRVEYPDNGVTNTAYALKFSY
jgi:hypothetical protein